jgi:hypothetical protein
MTAPAAVALGDSDWLRAANARVPLNIPGRSRRAADNCGEVRPARIRNCSSTLGTIREPTRLEDLEEVIYSQGSPLWRARMPANTRWRSSCCRGADGAYTCTQRSVCTGALRKD